MFRDIIVNLDVGRPDDPGRAYAISAAKALGTELAGIAFCYEPVTLVGAADTIPPDWIEDQRAENARAARDTIARFKEATSDFDLPVQEQTIEASLAGGAKIFGRLARTFDLSIISQTEPQKAAPDELIAEAALFESGRPVIVVPYIQKDGFRVDRVMVCWDGSRTAARALADAMPLLEFAKAIEIVTVGSGGKNNGGDVPFAEVGKHLARHGLKSETKRIVTDTDVAAAILSHAADFSADLIVMGGYGHSRLREFVLGGVTRSILNTMTVPVLMSH